MNNFDFANKIANFASDIDFDKNILSVEDQKSVSQVIETLYDLAESIAGDRSEELYKYVAFTSQQHL